MLFSELREKPSRRFCANRAVVLTVYGGHWAAAEGPTPTNAPLHTVILPCNKYMKWLPCGQFYSRYYGHSTEQTNVLPAQS